MNSKRRYTVCFKIFIERKSWCKIRRFANNLITWTGKKAICDIWNNSQGDLHYRIFEERTTLFFKKIIIFSDDILLGPTLSRPDLASVYYTKLTINL
jgi:hypothetical protein